MTSLHWIRAQIQNIFFYNAQVTKHAILALWHNRVYNFYYNNCCMVTSSNGTIFRVTDPLCGEFTGHRWIPHTKARDASFDFLIMRPNKRLSRQSLGWWFETPSRSLWRQCNVQNQHIMRILIDGRFPSLSMWLHHHNDNMLSWLMTKNMIRTDTLLLCIRK